MKPIYIVALLLALIVPGIILARVGVGVGTGKIYIKEPIHSGTVTDLPPFTVFNTGDETSGYEVQISVREYQPELKPDPSWFTFEPETFTLDPEKSQLVHVRINVPLKTVPGDYFAFLEAHPKILDNEPADGSARIGIAAASKLYFTVPASNIFQAIYYRTISLVRNTAPWSYIVLGVIIVAALGVFLKSKVSLNIAIKKK